MRFEDPDEFEERPAYRRVGSYLLGIFIVGIAAAALVYAVAMQGLGWPPAIIGGGETGQGSVAGISDTSRPTLFASPETRAHFQSVGGNYDAILQPWRKFLAARNIRYDEVTSLSDLDRRSSGVIILPSAVVLTPGDRQQLLAFRDRGGSVLATWASGTRAPGGQWVGWDFLENLGDARYVGEIPREAQRVHLVLTGASPLAPEFGPGKRIGTGATSEPVQRFRGNQVAGRHLEWARSSDTEALNEGTVLYSEGASGRGGRAVVLGFSETSWEFQATDMYTLLEGSLAWLRRQPVMVKAAWPQGRAAAQLIEMDTEHDFANAETFSRQLQETSVNGAFYVLTSLAGENKALLQRLAQTHQIGYHGDVHEGFKDQTEVVQEQRFAQMRQQLGAVLGDTATVLGFRAPGESYDKTTEIVAQKAGLRHHISDAHGSDTTLPFFAPIAGSTLESGLLLLPRTQRDDLLLLRQTQAPETLLQALRQDFDVNRLLGGLGVLSVHTQNFGAQQPLPQIMPAFLRHVKEADASVWTPTPQQMDTWWRDRERLRLVQRVTGARFEFDVSVGGNKPVDGGTFVVMLPFKGATPTVSSLKINMPLPKVVRLDDFRAALVFDSLPPGDYFYLLKF